MDMKHYLGVDVGGTKILAILADEQGNIRAEARQATSQQGEAALVAQIADMGKALARQTGATLHGAGIGMTSAVCPRTRALSMMPNIRGVSGTGFASALRAALACPLALENDVNAAALGEAWLGRQGDPLVFIALGTGIGMGLVAEGRLYRGHRGAAGEIALLPVGEGQGKAADYRRGMLESTLGGAAWLAAYRARGGDSTRTLAALFAAPDDTFRHILAEKSGQLALAILAISAVADPQTVCLGGSIGLQAALLAQTQQRLAEYCEAPPALCAAMLGDYAGALGAARAVILQENGKK